MKKIIVLIVVFATGYISTPTNAGIPVFDGGNLMQNIVTAIEEIAQTAKQIQEYETQLVQYENQLKNTLAPSTYIWDNAQKTINSLLDATNTLDNYKTRLGSLDNYLSKFQDVNYYRSSPCFSPDGCTAAEWEALQQNERLASESQKKTNDALFKGLDQQQTNLEADSITLERLQSDAEGATGQMQALGYANQLASQQSNQLLQIRALLIAQQNAVGTKMQADADKEAREAAASAQLRGGIYKTSPYVAW
jgi:P-type conjugative transfer protein TrbJ